MKKLLLMFPVIFVTGCAQQTGWTPVVDTYEQPQAVYVQPPQQQYNPNPQYQQGQGRANPPPGYVQPQGYYQRQQPNLNQAMAECKMLAERSAGGSGVGNTATGALGGAALGAAGGAIIGAFTGSAGTGAALGAAVGGLGGGTAGALSSNENYKRAYSNCLRNRGFNVVQ